MVVAAIQIVFFAMMPGLTDGYARRAFGFMLEPLVKSRSTIT